VFPSVHFKLALPFPVKVSESAPLLVVLVSVMVPLCGKQLVPFHVTLLNVDCVGLPGDALFSRNIVPLVTVDAEFPQLDTLTFNGVPPNVELVVTVTSMLGPAGLVRIKCTPLIATVWPVEVPVTV
jgi:hypothetical protein